MSTTTIIGVLVLILIVIVIFQIAKSIEYTSILAGEKEAKKKSNNVNAVLMIVFLVVGMLAVYLFNEKGKKLILTTSASVEGETYDILLWTTFIITGIVFFLTHITLFYFAFKYRHNENRKATYFSHSNKLEIIWTTIPAITMCVLVATGIRYWSKITGDAPTNSIVVEVTGKQFEWIFRYPGNDGILGKKYFKNINDANNRLGQIWEDKANHDDIITDELHLIVGKPVKLIIGSRDVIHDVGLPHFRMKMDAVPGLPTTMWFTPKYTTEEMKKITKNNNFEYEIACDQMCGKGHYSMRGVLVVETQAEFDKWISQKKSYYSTVLPEENKSNTTNIENNIVAANK